MGYEDTALLSGRVAQRSTADEVGNVLIDRTIESPSTAIDPRLAEYITYHVFNGGFARGPNDPSSNIDPVNNPLPDWLGPVVVGGSVTCTWAADASSPSGFNLRFTFSGSGAAADEVYLEQVVPILGYRARSWGADVYLDGLRVTASDNGFQLYSATQALDITGAAVGASTTQVVSFTADGQLFFTSNHVAGTGAAPPSNAAFVRIRIGAKRNTAATTATGTFDVPNVRMILGTFESIFADANTTANPSGSIANSTGALSIKPSQVSGGVYGQTFVYGGFGLLSINTATIGATVNNWAPANITNNVFIALTVSAAAVHITGISATGFVDGQMLWIRPNTNDVILDHNNVASAAGNRIACPAAANFTVRNGGAVLLVYSATLTNNANVPWNVMSP